MRNMLNAISTYHLFTAELSELVWRSLLFTFYYWGRGEGKGLGTWPYQICSAAHISGGQLPLANYREWPSSTAYRNSYTVSHPFQARVSKHG